MNNRNPTGSGRAPGTAAPKEQQDHAALQNYRNSTLGTSLQ